MDDNFDSTPVSNSLGEGMAPPGTEGLLEATSLSNVVCENLGGHYTRNQPRGATHLDWGRHGASLHCSMLNRLAL
jgi:hypothetical protein